MRKVFINIGELVQVREPNQPILKGAQMANIPTLTNAWMSVINGLIEDFGSMNDYISDGSQEIDLNGRMLTPTFVDSHTHLVFAADRDEEYVMKLKGIDYQSIAKAGRLKSLHW